MANRFDSASNTVRHLRSGEEIRWDRSNAQVANALVITEGGVRGFIVGYGGTLKQARSEARAWWSKHQRQSSGMYDKLSDS